MNKITVMLQLEKGDGNIPMYQINKLKDLHAEMMDVTDTSFESRWTIDTSLIMLTGKLKRKI